MRTSFNCAISSNKDKNEALNPLNMIILVLKVLMDLVSRVLIFFIFMIVHNNGEFSPMRTVTSFYTMVGIMTIFNIVFNDRRNFCSAKYWLGEFFIFHFISCTYVKDVVLKMIFQRLSSTLSVALWGLITLYSYTIWRFLYFSLIVSIKLIFKPWWITIERQDLISQSLWSSFFTTPL